MGDSVVERDSELAESESLETLSSALYAALEADLSSLGWPKNSRVLLNTSFETLDYLMTIADA